MKTMQLPSVLSIRTFIIISIIFSSFIAVSQTDYQGVKNNRIINKYFAGQMQDFEINNPSLAANLKIYFTESFVAQKVGCPSCEIDSNELFNLELFDVLALENMRGESEQISVSSRSNKYSIQLLSSQELTPLIGGVSPEELIIQSFPKWKASGDDEADEKKYRNDCKRWEILLWEHFLLMTQSPDLMSITINDFLALAEQDRNNILSHPGGYILLIP